MLGAFGEVVDADSSGFPDRLDVSERNVSGYVESLLIERLLNQLVGHLETQVRQRGRRTRGCRWLRRRRRHVGRGANVNRLGCDVRRAACALRGRLDGRGFRVVGGIGVVGSPRILLLLRRVDPVALVALIVDELADLAGVAFGGHGDCELKQSEGRGTEAVLSAVR